MKIRVTLLFLFFTSHLILVAQTSYLDSTFNSSGAIKGKKEIDFGGSEEATAVTVDLLGRTLVLAKDVEGSAIYVTRLRLNGEVDTTFANNGVYTNIHTEPQQALCILRQPDGKILIGGSRSDGNNGDLPMVIRLNNDGTPDVGFGIAGISVIDFQPGPGYDQISKIDLQSDGRIIIGGSGSNSLFIARLRADGNLDQTFNSPQGLRYENLVEGNITGLDISPSDGILLSANSGASSYNIRIFNYKADGSYTSIGKDSLSFSGMQSTGIVIIPGGKAIMGLSDGSYYYAMRFNSNGKIDSTYGNLGMAISPLLYAAYSNNILLDSKGKTIVTGSYSYYGYAAVRFDENGSIDSTFANNGVYTEYPSQTASCNNSCLTPDNKVFLVGEENGNATIEKIENSQVAHIIGDDYVLPGTSELYELKVPSSWPYTYAWDYTGDNYFFVPDSIGQKVLILFDDDATDGKLICSVYSGSYLYTKISMDIKINHNPSQANLLADVQCPKEVTDCYNNYISYFKLNLIRNDSSTCNSTGYSDFTRSQWVDTLIAGGAYSAVVRAESPDELKYAAIWIDYNNDGYFDSTSEFVSQTYGTGPLLNLQNIILKNKAGYSGPRRLRVRCRPASFTAGEACQVSGELGETEDYMIIIQDVAKLEAPEIITPNDDGKNDYFIIRGIDPSFDNALTIFDRYGEVVFTTSNYENNWKGEGKSGEKVTPGTYYYYFKNNDDFIRGFVEVRY